MIQSTASTPLWLELTKATIGPVIAAIFVVIGILWRDRIERRNAAQEWYEQTYISDGLDIVIAHLAVLTHAASEGRRLMTEIQVTPLPSVVSRRLLSLELVDFLMGVDTAEAIVLAWARRDRPIKLTQDESRELMAFCVGLTVYADAIRVFLLNKKIGAKSDVHKIAKDPKLIALTRALQATFIQQEWLQAELQAMTEGLKMKYRERIAEAAYALKTSQASPT